MHIEISGTLEQPVVSIDSARSSEGWDRIESSLSLFAAEHLQDLVALHAALIVTESGAIVFPGRTHSGKSTLAAAAQLRGLRVLSDEYTLVDTATGFVQGWPRPLRIRTPRGIERICLDDHEQSLAFESHPVLLVADLRFQPQPEHIVEISRADMAMHLLENTVCAKFRPEDSFRAALAVTKDSVCLGGRRAEAEAAWDRILDCIA